MDWFECKCKNIEQMIVFNVLNQRAAPQLLSLPQNLVWPHDYTTRKIALYSFCNQMICIKVIMVVVIIQPFIARTFLNTHKETDREGKTRKWNKNSHHFGCCNFIFINLMLNVISRQNVNCFFFSRFTVHYFIQSVVSLKLYFWNCHFFRQRSPSLFSSFFLQILPL